MLREGARSRCSSSCFDSQTQTLPNWPNRLTFDNTLVVNGWRGRYSLPSSVEEGSFYPFGSRWAKPLFLCEGSEVRHDVVGALGINVFYRFHLTSAFHHDLFEVRIALALN